MGLNVHAKPRLPPTYSAHLQLSHCSLFHFKVRCRGSGTTPSDRANRIATLAFTTTGAVFYGKPMLSFSTPRHAYPPWRSVIRRLMPCSYNCCGMVLGHSRAFNIFTLLLPCTCSFRWATTHCRRIWNSLACNPRWVTQRPILHCRCTYRRHGSMLEHVHQAIDFCRHYCQHLQRHPHFHCYLLARHHAYCRERKSQIVFRQPRFTLHLERTCSGWSAVLFVSLRLVIPNRSLTSGPPSPVLPW
jgi:hypothetical protein